MTGRRWNCGWNWESDGVKGVDEVDRVDLVDGVDAVDRGSLNCRGRFRPPRPSLPLGRAFTLIELLIVVAIIAILAAIAVPNLLEAQVRAKVSRVASDLRTLATAIESYRTDNNGYPVYAAITAHTPGAPIEDPAASTGMDYFEYLARRPGLCLTTPIAYAASIPPDPFATRYAGTGPEPVVFDYAYKNARFNAALFVGPPEPWLGPGGIQFIQDWGEWRLVSAGPDLDRTDDVKVNRIYDPTNGTVSDGDIVRTQRHAHNRPKG